MFRAALKSVANPVVITDPTGTIQWVNPAFTRLSGYGTDEAVGRNPRILKSGVHPAAFYKDLWDTVLEGRVWHGEVVERHKDGHHYTVEQTITPMMDGGGAITHFVAVHNDVTDLRASQKRLKAIFDHALDAIVVTDDRGRFVDANPAACTLTGYSRDELLTVGPADLAAPDRDWRSLREQLLAAKANGEGVSPFSVVHRTGRVVETEYRASASILPGLNVSMLRDVTERNASIRKLAASETRLRKLAENATDIVVIMHVDDQLHLDLGYVNPAAATLFDEPVEAGPREMPALVEACHPDDLATMYRLVMESGVNAERGTVRIRKHSGEWVHLEAIATTVHESDGTRTVQLIARDVTDKELSRAALEAALSDQRAAAAALELVNETRRRLLQNVSHELRTPLTVILGFADMLARSEVPMGADQLRDLHERILRNARHLEEIVDDLRDLDPSDGRPSLDQVEVELAELVRTAVEVGVLEDRKVTLDLEPIQLTADARKVRRIVDSLLSNVARHTPPETSVIVRVHGTAGGAHLTVEDDGPGIPVEMRALLLEPFQQGVQAINDAKPGAGLGLALVKVLTDAHDGHAWIDSPETGGSAVHITLPRRRL